VLHCHYCNGVDCARLFHCLDLGLRKASQRPEGGSWRGMQRPWWRVLPHPGNKSRRTLKKHAEHLIWHQIGRAISLGFRVAALLMMLLGCAEIFLLEPTKADLNPVQGILISGGSAQTIGWAGL